MPIEGITTGIRDYQRYAQLGKLRKGGKKVNGQYGPDLTHFRIDFAPQFKFIEEDFHRIYGEKPQEFPRVFLLGETPEKAFDVWMRGYGANQSLKRLCDRKQQHLWLGSDGAYHSIENEKAPACQYPQCKCTRVGILSIVFFDLLAQTGVLGSVALEIKGIHEIRRIHAMLTEMYEKGAKINEIPFTLGRREEQIFRAEFKDGKPTGSRVRVNKSLVYIYPTPEFVKARFLPALDAPIETPLLPTGTAPSMTRDEFVFKMEREGYDEQETAALLKMLGILNTDGIHNYDFYYSSIRDYIAALPTVDGEIVEDDETGE